MRRINHIFQRIALTSVILTLIFLTQTVTMASTNLTVYPVKDTYCKSNDPNHCFGSSPQLELEYASYNKSIAFIGFRVLQSVPVNAKIIEARLTFFVDRCYYKGDIDVCSIDENWNEYSLNWNNQPSFKSVYATKTVNVQWAKVTVDVTKLVRLWMNGAIPDYGLALNPNENPESPWRCVFFSREWYYTPFLTVIYE